MPNSELKMTTANRKVNPHLVELIGYLKAVSRENEARVWRDVAERLERSGKNWSEVNVSRLARFAKEGEMLVVPGKLLGSGTISFGVTVAAYKTSAQAKGKIEAVGGKAMTIKELVAANPSGEGIRIMG